MNRKTFGLAFVSALFVLVPAFDANAWMDQWAPAFKATPAKVQALSRTSVSNYVCTASEDYEWDTPLTLTMTGSKTKCSSFPGWEMA